MINVMLTDDHRIVMDGLKHILSQEKDIKIIASAENGIDLLAILRGGMPVDVLVLDMSMPGKSGLDLIRQLRRYFPDLPILILSMYPEAVYGLRALRCGANGYLTKDSDAAELVRAIRSLAAGGSFVSEEMALQLIENSRAAPSRCHEVLSDRELQVLQLLASGVSSTAIANRLSLSIKTISTHKTNIQNKLNLTGTAHLIHYAMQNGLIAAMD